MSQMKLDELNDLQTAVVQRYLKGFEKVEPLRESLMAKKETEQPQKEDPEEDFIDFLIDAYLCGFFDIGLLLGDESKIPSYVDMTENLDKSYDGISIEEKFWEHYDNDNTADMNVLLECEYHRMYNAGAAYKAKLVGNVFKEWVTMGDEKVRDTHFYLDGVVVPYDGVFVTYDGDEARYPGDFMLADNNCGCRCWLLYSLG